MSIKIYIVIRENGTTVITFQFCYLFILLFVCMCTFQIQTNKKKNGNVDLANQLLAEQVKKIGGETKRTHLEYNNKNNDIKQNQNDDIDIMAAVAFKNMFGSSDDSETEFTDNDNDNDNDNKIESNNNNFIQCKYNNTNIDNVYESENEILQNDESYIYEID